MNVLAIDTCLDACSAAVLAGDSVLAAKSEVMARGHQERLGGLVAEVMVEAGLAFAALDRIAVTIGPGSFTGLRVGLAFAKGLALALDRPCLGVGVLEAMAEGRGGDRLAVCVDARRGQVYLQMFEAGRAVGEARALSPELARARLAAFSQAGGVSVIGTGAALVAEPPTGFEAVGRDHDDLGLNRPKPALAPDPVAVARLAARRTPPFGPARPAYLRPPDAKPSVP